MNSSDSGYLCDNGSYRHGHGYSFMNIASLMPWMSMPIFRQLLDFSPNLIFLLDAGGRVNYANETALCLLGMDIPDIISKPLDVLGFLFPESFETCFPEFCTDENNVFYDISFQKSEGRSIPLEVNIIQFFFQGKKLYFFSGRDISKRKSIEEALIDAKISEAIASDVKNRFLANLSHELRNPLSGLLGMLKLIEKERFSEQEKEYFSNAVTCAENLSGMINDLLLLSEIENTKTEPLLFRVDDMIEHLEYLFREKVENKSLTLTINKEFNNFFFYNDKIKIQQIIIHLFLNAVKFSETGNIFINFYHDEKLFIAISDQGIGIPEEFRDKIFLPFFQLDDPYRKEYSGMGVGLSIVKKLLNLVGGAISIQSKPGYETTFIVEIPSLSAV